MRRDRERRLGGMGRLGWPQLWLVLLGLFLGACGVAQTPHIKDGKPYGVIPGPFRDKWWNYYQRGLSFADGGFYDEALADLSQAVRRRADDQWRARTYGMHFLDYFPHREQGILHYRLQRYEDAIRELERSLSSATSAKGAYFLNRARAAVLEQTGNDRHLPELALEVPLDGGVTREFHATVSGTASDDQFVSSVSVNGTLLLLEQSTPEFTFATRVPLGEGRNEIRVRAADLTGKEALEILDVVADRRGPTITISRLDRTGGGQRLTGYLTDETGVVRFSVNGSPQETDPQAEVPLDVELGLGPVRVEAEDRAGNVTVAEILPVKKAALPRRWPRFASLGTLLGGPSVDHHRSSHSGRRTAGLSKLFDDTPPEILLRDLPVSLETFHDRILVEGSAADTGTVASLTVNGEVVTRRQGRRVFFSHLLGLAVGPNRIVVEAADERGNIRSREFVVERKVPQLRQLGSRMSIALLTLEQRGAASVAGAAMTDRLISAFVSQGRFNLVERERIRAVLAELSLSGSLLADQSTAPRLGRVVAADSVLAGAVQETERSIEVVTHLVDSESGELLAIHDAFDEARTLAAVDTLAERLAFKYRREFPLLEGRILEVSGGQVLVDLGKKRGLRSHRKLLLFRPGAEAAPHSFARAGTQADVLLGEAKVVEVFPESARTRITRQDTELHAYDRVLTK